MDSNAIEKKVEFFRKWAKHKDEQLPKSSNNIKDILLVRETIEENTYYSVKKNNNTQNRKYKT